jgi:hypothetical protein
MAQTWQDLLFAHWPVPVEALRAFVPEPLAIDTFEGTAWVGVVPFRMSGVRPRGLPAIRGLSAFPELNVRTYVTHRVEGAPQAQRERPGVWFFSLDAASRVAVRIARAWFGLPYFDARMSCEAEGDGLRYASERLQRGASKAALQMTYRPTGPVELARPETLDAWLTERYCLYAERGRRLFRGEIHHAPWPLQPAAAEFTRNTMTQGLCTLPATDPLLHFARRLDVVVWPIEPALS